LKTAGNTQEQANSNRTEQERGLGMEPDREESSLKTFPLILNSCRGQMDIHAGKWGRKEQKEEVENGRI
jgi:hypothetical protein